MHRCSVLMGNGCYSSVSIQQLVPNPLGRNAFSNPPSLPAYRPPPVCTLLCSAWTDAVSDLQPPTCMHAAQQGLHQGQWARFVHIL